MAVLVRASSTPQSSMTMAMAGSNGAWGTAADFRFVPLADHPGRPSTQPQRGQNLRRLRNALPPILRESKRQWGMDVSPPPPKATHANGARKKQRKEQAPPKRFRDPLCFGGSLDGALLCSRFVMSPSVRLICFVSIRESAERRKTYRATLQALSPIAPNTGGRENLNILPFAIGKAAFVYLALTDRIMVNAREHVPQMFPQLLGFILIGPTTGKTPVNAHELRG